jgi:CheY-like chemotaxis protein
VNVKITQDSNKLEIAVSDTGTGIAQEFLPYVFDRFSQEDSSSTRPHDGLGLGLAIVKHLAELHGGGVSAHSDGAGKGSTFVVSLPRTLPSRPLVPNTADEVNGKAPDPPAPAKLDGLRILVVDDDVDTCEMLKFALHLNGADVISSSSVDEAFVSIESWKPDVLLTDINMPEKDGYSLIERLRSSGPDGVATIPVIALTAMARSEDSERALSAGFQLHLPKPVDIDALGDAIAKLVNKGS